MMGTVSYEFENFSEKSLPVTLLRTAKELYSSLTHTLGEMLLKTIIILTSPIWCTVFYVLLAYFNGKSRRTSIKLRNQWKDAPKNQKMFQLYKQGIKAMRGLEDEKGEFRMPIRITIFNPIIKQIRKFYYIVSDQTMWLESKLYPTAEELGIPPEDVEHLRAQLTEEDFKDLNDPCWIDAEAECIIKN